MKKIKILIATAISILCIFGLSSNSTFASSFSVDMSGPTTFEDSTTIIVKLGGYSDVNMEYGGIMVITANLVYDSSKIDVVPSALNGFSKTGTTTLVLDRESGVSSGADFLSLAVTNKSLNNEESTTIVLSNIVGSDSFKDIPAPDRSIIIKRNAPTKSEDKPAITPTARPSTSPRQSSSSHAPTNVTGSSGLEEKVEAEVDEAINNETEKGESYRGSSEKEVTKEEDSSTNSVSLWMIFVLIIIVIIVTSGLIIFFLKRRKQKSK